MHVIWPTDVEVGFFFFVAFLHFCKFFCVLVMHVKQRRYRLTFFVGVSLAHPLCKICISFFYTIADPADGRGSAFFFFFYALYHGTRY
ncbi:hypothetical protein T492DRAFT_232771 [Pavlovales sp. CCMP2436]|nr:hypothetical protein T492DRAFT_232771 [Pavlovales sp. CCMP2436]